MKKGVMSRKEAEFFKYDKLLLLTIICISLFAGFVLAITGLGVGVSNTLKEYVTGGDTSFNATEDITHIYNFTVNSSDVVSANITKINITLPKGVNCYYNTNKFMYHTILIMATMLYTMLYVCIIWLVHKIYFYCFI